MVEDDEPCITTGKDYYCVEKDTPMTEDERIKINEMLCASELGRYRVDGHMLFIAIEEENGQEDVN